MAFGSIFVNRDLNEFAYFKAQKTSFKVYNIYVYSAELIESCA